MIEWIKAWTFFNWLALLAFLLGLVGFLNAVLSLRSRYKDWRATKSKEAFQKRISELLTQIDRTEEYIKTPVLLVIDIIEELVIIAALLLGSFIFLMFLLVQYFPAGDSSFELVGVAIAQLGALIVLTILMKPIVDFIKIYMKIRYFKRPEFLIVALTRLLKDGEKKNLTTNEEVIRVITKIAEKEMYAGTRLEEVTKTPS